MLNNTCTIDLPNCQVHKNTTVSHQYIIFLCFQTKKPVITLDDFSNYTFPTHDALAIVTMC